MSTLTGGTKATTTLTALEFPSISSTTLSDTDVATMNGLVVDDNDPSVFRPGCVVRGGLLTIPNRGVLKLLPGDWVMIGPEGWPILVADIACPTTLTLTGTPISGSPLMTMASSVAVAGWQVGSQVTGTGIPAGTLITAIDVTNLILTLSKNATSSPGATTITAGSFTHS